MILTEELKGEIIDGFEMGTKIIEVKYYAERTGIAQKV